MKKRLAQKGWSALSEEDGLACVAPTTAHGGPTAVRGWRVRGGWRCERQRNLWDYIGGRCLKAMEPYIHGS